MKKKSLKLSLNKETLHRMDVRAGGAFAFADDSCLDSCYFRSCDGGCTISTEIKTQAEIQ